MNYLTQQLLNSEELEKIRNFLTGQAMSSILDAFFSIIYIVVMVFL